MRVTCSQKGVSSCQQSSRILWKPKALFMEKLFMATSLRHWGRGLCVKLSRYSNYTTNTQF
jgi:hypothetical protein